MNRIEINIRQRVGNFVKAICAKDIDGVMSLYTPELVSFHLTAPLRHFEADGKRRAWQGVFAQLSGPFAYDVRDLNITTNGESAFAMNVH